MTQFQAVIDEADIRKLHLRYCRGVDRMDWELVRSCYHPEATDDHGSYKGGIDGFLEWVAGALTRFETTTHFTGNQLVEVTGDAAWAEHYAVVYHRRPASADAPRADLIVNVRYVDRLSRRDGEWRIAERVVVIDSDRVDIVRETWIGAEVSVSRRDASDPSYAMAARVLALPA